MGKRKVSIVIPVYNEEKILETAVNRLKKDLDQFRDEFDFEIILAENGSTDRTIEKGGELSKIDSSVSIFHYEHPDYGLALQEGIRRAGGEIIVCDEIDLCLPEFYEKALAEFKNSDAQMVVGSKRAKGANDQRPFKRRFATWVLNVMLKIILGFKGTDTHGVKAFVKKPLMPVLDKCLVGKDIFASEFVIRAERMGIKVKEVPISLDEKRAPSIKLMKRVPKVLSNLAYLFWNIRIRNR
ncbi:MAG TPA: glycosyltransferase family 2 protein [bacterium]|jgi:glycosyltransferase involved in cell wall biosynthesis|nr:glycosyltransferase family 2 protein [bacterium]MDX9805778.1 glycosyltransferase family 2 protein [bacterium]HNZ53367.1 glycosyltransferase family 2 protein [bacterium]HOG42918.1 glycosyltransferase family 2 protein [bacterium]HPA56184.1 glycosyltransferase family 2 protein [bacterium]